MGYHRAGFDVVGVDIRPQRRYPFEFHQADAMTFPLGVFAAVHASPPCQEASKLRRSLWPGREHADLIPAIRARLIASGLPYVIENVPGAVLFDPVTVCGSSVGLPVRRHRLFESNIPLMVPPCAHGMWPPRYRIRQHGREFDTAVCYVFGGGPAGQPVAARREAMGIDWMTRDELSQAIPPAFTEVIGGFLFDAIMGVSSERLEWP